MPTALRRIGLGVVGDMPWGTHFCLFYETRQDLLDTLVPYFKAGLENNEFCIWVLSASDPVTENEAWSALRRASPDLARREATDRLELLSHEEWFLQSGKFEVGHVMSVLRDRLRKAVAAGRDGIRINGGTAWLQKQNGDDFFAFEHALDSSIAGSPVITLCNFPLAESTAADLLAAAKTHHFAVARRQGAWQIVHASEAPTDIPSLTPRELEVLTWAARGKSARDIATILHITKRTVDQHIANATQKLGAANRTQAVALALLMHIIEI